MITSKANVLREFLYNRLTKLFRYIKIVNQGEPCTGVVTPSPFSPKGKALKLERWGEAYVMNCPYCNDTRFRLYVGHLWGYYDERTGTRNWWMIKCFNEDCLATHEKRMKFADQIFDQLAIGCGADKVKTAKVQEQYTGPIPMPGEVTLVNKLVDGHPAKLYLTSRGFDVEELGSLYEVSYCTDARFPFSLALNRLVIPVKQNGRLIGWQARYLGDRKEWKTGVPKYFNLASRFGFRKSNCLYNLDNATESNYVVLMEGPTDVWRYGQEAVAAFGKSVSQQQLELLRLNFDRIVILLDSDAEDESKTLYEKLVPHVQRVLRIQLKQGLDPGSLSREKLRQCVASEMKRTNFLE